MAPLAVVSLHGQCVARLLALVVDLRSVAQPLVFDVVDVARLVSGSDRLLLLVAGCLDLVVVAKTLLLLLLSTVASCTDPWISGAKPSRRAGHGRTGP